MKTNKLLSVVLTLCVLLAALSLTALAADVADVAEISGMGYETLEAAITSANDGETVTLLCDVTIEGSQLIIEEGKTLTLDLAGKTLKISKYTTEKAQVLVKGDLTLTDSVGGGKICSDFTGTTGRVVSVEGDGKLTVKGGTITTEGMQAAGSAVYVGGNGAVTMTGGKIHVDAKRANTAVNVKNSSAKFEMTGGTVIADEGDGTETSITAVSGNYNSTITISGDSVISAPQAILASSSNITVTGGTFSGTVKAKKGSITGGTFTDDVSAYVPDAAGCVLGEDGSYTVVEAMYAAKIGTTKYESLEAAITSANDGETVTLLSDVTEDVTISKNITLDLGGNKLTNKNAGKATLTVAAGATAVVKNGSIVGGTGHYNIAVGTKDVRGGTLTLENVTATAGNTGSSMIDNWGTLTIESGTYTGGLNVVKSEEGSTLTINDGEFTLNYAPSSGYTAAILTYGETVINGGTFVQTATPKWGYPQVVMAGVVEGYTSTVKVTGGSFTNKKTGNNIFYGYTPATAANFEVSGGTFNKSVDESYCADGFIPTKNADSTYGVKEGKYVAKIGSKNYETLADAIRLAAEGKTVTLLCDVTENVEIAAAKNLTLDLAGYTLSGGTNNGKAALLNYGTLTITDSSTDKTGTIKREDDGDKTGTSYYVINNQGTLTIEQANILNNSGYKQANSSGSMVGSSLICNGDNGKQAVLNIKGGKLEQLNFIAIKNGELGEVYMTGGTVTSNHSALQNWYKAEITGGELNGQLWTDAWEENSTGNTVIGGDATFTGEIVVDITGEIAPRVSITGGQLDVTNWRMTTNAANANATIAISGGTFSSAVPADFCATGYVPVANGDDTYGVKKNIFGKFGYFTNKQIVTDEEPGKTYYPISIYSGIDSLNYKAVGFDWYVVATKVDGTKLDESNTQEPYQTSTVYTKIIATDSNGKEVTYSAVETFKSQYIYNMVVRFNTENYTSANTALYVTPYVITLDGEKITGEMHEISNKTVSSGTLFRDSQQ